MQERVHARKGDWDVAGLGGPQERWMGWALLSFGRSGLFFAPLWAGRAGAWMERLGAVW